MQETKNYKLKMPDQEDYYSVEDSNDNMQIVDTVLTTLSQEMKELEKEVSVCFQSVSNGKELIKTAITGVDSTIQLPDSPTFEALASSIGQIKTGVDTSDATAVASEIRWGKTAYVNGKKIRGSAYIKSEPYSVLIEDGMVYPKCAYSSSWDTCVKVNYNGSISLIENHSQFMALGEDVLTLVALKPPFDNARYILVEYINGNPRGSTHIPYTYFDMFILGDSKVIGADGSEWPLAAVFYNNGYKLGFVLMEDDPYPKADIEYTIKIILPKEAVDGGGRPGTLSVYLEFFYLGY